MNASVREGDWGTTPGQWRSCPAGAFEWSCRSQRRLGAVRQHSRREQCRSHIY